MKVTGGFRKNIVDLRCGRAEVCGNCEDLDAGTYAKVCGAVAYIAGLPDPEDLSYEDIVAAAEEFAGSNPPTEVVVEAADSAYQLIVNHR